MPYAIVRIAKLKQSNIAGSGMHVWRTRHTPNADRSKLEDNQTLIHERDLDLSLAELVARKIDETPQIRKIRTDAVHAVEFLLTASPEYFRPDNPGDYGAYRPDRLARWQEATIEWLQQEYGSKIVRARLHLDEATPHIHAYLVPIDSNGQLNCKKIFGGRHKMLALQDSYALAMKPLGLERGIRGSQAEHTAIKDYYTVVNASVNNESSLQTLQTKAAAYDALKRECQELDRRLKSVAQERDRIEERLKASQHSIELQSQIVRSFNSPTTLTLEQIACELNPSQPLPQPSGTAIDLIQTTLDLDYQSAMRWTVSRFGAAAAIDLARTYNQEFVTQQPVPSFVPPRSVNGKWDECRRWLLASQQLPAKSIDRLHDEGLLYADERGRLICIHRSLDLRTTGATAIDFHPDPPQYQTLDGSSSTAGWYFFQSSPSTPERAIVVDSPIEAMAHATLHPAAVPTLYLSINQGGWLPSDDRFVRLEIEIATDCHLPNLPRLSQMRLPSGKSWSEDLAAYLSAMVPDVSIESLKQENPPPTKINSIDRVPENVVDLGAVDRNADRPLSAKEIIARQTQIENEPHAQPQRGNSASQRITRSARSQQR